MPGQEWYENCWGVNRWYREGWTCTKLYGIRVSDFKNTFKEWQRSIIIMSPIRFNDMVINLAYDNIIEDLKSFQNSLPLEFYTF